MADATADMLEKLRQSGLRIDREGELMHEGEVIQHHGLRAAIFHWLDRLPGGRFILRLDAQRFVYIDVEDTPLVARALRWDHGRPMLLLSDGQEEALDPDTLTVDREGVLRCQVRERRLPARLSSSATVALAEHIHDGDGGPALQLDDGTFPLGH